MKTAKNKLLRISLLAILIAIELLMFFTVIGYIPLGVTSVTLMAVPVAVGAVVLGPTAGGILGFIFGITSFVQCLGIYRPDAFGILLFGISPVKTFLLTVVTRTLMGIAVGWIYKGLSKIKWKHFPVAAAIFSCGFIGLGLAALLYANTPSVLMYLVSAIALVLAGFLYHFVSTLDVSAAPAVLSACSAAVLNTVFFVSALVFLFGQDPSVLAMFGESATVTDIITALVTVNAVLEAAVCLILGTAVSKALISLQKKIALPADKKKKAAEKAEPSKE